MKVVKNFSLDEETVLILKVLAKKLGKSESEIVRELIRKKGEEEIRG